MEQFVHYGRGYGAYHIPQNAFLVRIRISFKCYPVNRSRTTLRM